MDDDLEPILVAELPATTRGKMTLSLPVSSRQMRLSSAAVRWLREVNGMPDDAPLRIGVARFKGGDRLAVYRAATDDDGLVVDPGNGTCSGVMVRAFLGEPKGHVSIPLTPNAERCRLDGGEPVTIPSKDRGVPAAQRRAASTPPAGSERTSPADESGPRSPSGPAPGGGEPVQVPPPTPPQPSKAQRMRDAVAKATEMASTTAPCPHPNCGAEGVQQGSLYDYRETPPRETARIFSCSNGHRFEMVPKAQLTPVYGESLTPEEAAAADAVLAEDAESEVDPAWLEALQAGTGDEQ